MCSNKKCPNHDRRSIYHNGCKIFAGVSCIQCRDFRP